MMGTESDDIMQAGNASNSSLDDHPSKSEYVIDNLDIVYVFGEIVIALAAIFGNSLVLVAIWRESRLQTINNYFIANLAAADLLVGILGIPCALLPNLGKPEGFGGCLFVNSLIIILTQISIFGLLVIALERFAAIRYPFQYKLKFTGKLTICVVSVVWVSGIAVGALPLLGWNKFETYSGPCKFTEVIDMEYMVYFNFFGCVLGPLVAMFGIYCYIFHIVKKQLKQIASLHQAAVTAITYSNTQDERHLVAAQRNTKDAFSKETKAAKWFAIVILVFALCWLPLHIINTFIVLTGKSNYASMLAAILLSHTNSAINPVLYAYANTKFKSAFKKMFCCGGMVTEINSNSQGNASHDQTRPEVNGLMPLELPNQSALQNNSTAPNHRKSSANHCTTQTYITEAQSTTDIQQCMPRNHTPSLNNGSSQNHSSTPSNRSPNHSTGS